MANNSGLICKACANERLVKWQECNKNTPIEKEDWVKIGFKQDNVTEWMWVFVTDILPNNHYKGILDSKPVRITNYHHLDPVLFTRESIADLIKENDE